MHEKPEHKKNNYSCPAILMTSALVIYCLSWIFGEGLGGSWGGNMECYKFFGCTAGFFGYDALEHLFFGLATTFVLIWLCRKFPKYSIFHDNPWINFLIIIAFVALASVVWEFLECAHDYFRLDILHQPLLNIKLQINLLDQPTNLDTMGDLAFGLVGSFIALFFSPRTKC